MIVSVSSAAAAAQQSASFEAASVKRHVGPGGGFLGRQPGGRFTADGVSLRDLIVFAYDVQTYQIVGGPDWLDKERWDIKATGAHGTPEDELIALQQLLADRFSLLVRRGTRELPIFALVVARTDGRLGPQLQRSATDCAALKAEAARTRVVPQGISGVCYVRGRVGSIQMGGSRIADFVERLSERLQRTVVDRTSLAGPWDLTLTYTPEPSQIAPGAVSPGTELSFDPNGPSIFTAMQEQLGLRLDAARAPMTVLAVERAEFARGE